MKQRLTNLDAQAVLHCVFSQSMLVCEVRAESGELRVGDRTDAFGLVTMIIDYRSRPPTLLVMLKCTQLHPIQNLLCHVDPRLLESIN
jgi:hypothetical protein